MAGSIEKELGIKAEIVPGSLGQFDVEADGQVIASKEKGLLKRAFGNPWPDPQVVIEALRARMART